MPKSPAVKRLKTPDVFQFVNAKKFFEEMAPDVRSWKPKLKGETSRGTPLTFTPEDLQAIEKGIQKLQATFTTWSLSYLKPFPSSRRTSSGS